MTRRTCQSPAALALLVASDFELGFLIMASFSHISRAVVAPLALMWIMSIRVHALAIAFLRAISLCFNFLCCSESLTLIYYSLHLVFSPMCQCLSSPRSRNTIPLGNCRFQSSCGYVPEIRFKIGNCSIFSYSRA